MNPTEGTPMTWTLARRASRLNPSTIREILKITERPGIISLAGGLPSADTFPVQAMAEATARVLRDSPREALQYAASEGFGPLREWVAGELAAHGMRVDADQVLMHGRTGQQRRDRRLLGIDSAIGQDDDVIAFIDRRLDPRAHLVQGA